MRSTRFLGGCLSTMVALLGCGEEARISADAHLSDPLSSQMLRFAAVLLPFALVACGGEPPTDVPALSTLVLRTETTGEDLDPDGYTIQLDGQAPRPIGLNDSLITPNIIGGVHTVEMGGLADNCSLEAGNPLSVAVLPGVRTEVALIVSYLGPRGILNVRTFTRGTGGDVDGFVVRVDGTRTRSIARTGAIGMFVSAGDHEVLLEGLTDRCRVEGPNPQTVTVAQDDVLRITFLVDCTISGG